MTDLHPPAIEEHALRALLNRMVPVSSGLRRSIFLAAEPKAAQVWKAIGTWLVVVPDDTPAERLTVLAGYEAVCGTGVPADVVPTRRSRFEALKEQVCSLSYVACLRRKN
jgi:hypothetical protein